MSDIKHMNIKEFCDQGYLQEVNRLFFHPLGLALEVMVDDKDETQQYISGVWDYRDDPEGMQFGFNDLETYWDIEHAAAKAQMVADQRQRVLPGRRAALGFDIEPIPGYNSLWDGDLISLIENDGKEGD